MGDDNSGGINPEASATPDGADVRILEIVNKKGLHARASAKFCRRSLSASMPTCA